MTKAWVKNISDRQCITAHGRKFYQDIWTFISNPKVITDFKLQKENFEVTGKMPKEVKAARKAARKHEADVGIMIRCVLMEEEWVRTHPNATKLKPFRVHPHWRFQKQICKGKNCPYKGCSIHPERDPNQEPPTSPVIVPKT